MCNTLDTKILLDITPRLPISDEFCTDESIGISSNVNDSVTVSCSSVVSTMCGPRHRRTRIVCSETVEKSCRHCKYMQYNSWLINVHYGIGLVRMLLKATTPFIYEKIRQCCVCRSVVTLIV